MAIDDIMVGNDANESKTVYGNKDVHAMQCMERFTAKKLLTSKVGGATPARCTSKVLSRPGCTHEAS
jgi:hypothetical protein